jgi:membrane protease YdiL (CAAX protease family)
MHLGCVGVLALALDRSWAVAISLVLQIVLILGASTLFGGNARDVLALGRPVGSWRAYAGAFLLVPALVAYALLAIVVFSLWGEGVTLPPAFPPVLEGTEWALWLAVAVVLGPVREELLFRGFMLPALAQTRLGFWGAALVVAGAWAAFHGSLLRLVPVFAIGALLAWLLRRTGSLRVPIFSHAVHNLIVVLAPLAGLPVWPAGGPMG